MNELLFWLRRPDLNQRPVAVPEKIIGLALVLDFFDRGHSFFLALSSTGRARKRPLRVIRPSVS